MSSSERWVMRLVLLAAGALGALGCSDLVTATRAGDAQPADAEGVRDVAEASSPDAPTVGPVNRTVRVVLGPQRPLQPGAGFAVRAENEAGAFVERTTGPDGVATLPLDPAAGPWDLTVARAGCVAVSLLAIQGNFGGEIYSECNASRPAFEHVHTLRIGVAGVRDLSSGPSVCPAGLLQGDALDQTQVSFAYRADAPPVDVWAVQFDTLHDDAHPRNIARAMPVALLDRDVAAEVVMPAVPVAVVRSTVAVQFPARGLLTGASGAHAAGHGPVTRSLTGAAGTPTPCRVGTGTWTPPDASGRASWQFETFAPPCAPDSAAIALDADTPDAPLYGTLRVRTFADGATVTLREVLALATDAPSPGVVRLTVDAPGYDYAGFVARADAPNVHGEWRGYAMGGALRARRLPHLPSSVSRADLTYGFAQSGRFLVHACVGAATTGARPPRAPDSEPDVLLCDARSPSVLSD